MTILSKKEMSEEDIKLNYITPAIQTGWSDRITMETKITDGRINIKGNMVSRSKPKFVDYMLYYTMESRLPWWRRRITIIRHPTACSNPML